MSKKWLAAAMLGATCTAISSGFEPWLDALAGAFLPADIAQDAAAARLFVDRVNPYGPAIRDAQASLTGLALPDTFPHFPHPPFSLIVSLPLAFMTFSTGAAVWFGLTLALVFLLGALIDSIATASAGAVPTLGAWKISLLLLAWPPVLYNLEKGQWSVLLAVLLALAARSIHRGETRGAAAWAAAAAAVKVFPVVIGGYFLVRSPRTATWFAAVGISLTALPLLWLGFDAFPAFVRESQLNMPYWESFPSVMFSIHGVIARFLVGGQWAEPFMYAPGLAQMLDVLTMATLVGAAVWISIRSVRVGSADPVVFAAWMVLLPIVNPQSLGHNGVLLAVPVAILGRELFRTNPDWRHWTWAASIALVSVPKQSVWRLAPPPVGPVEGLLIVALPTWGALMLFVVAVSLSRQGLSAPAPRGFGSGSAKIFASPQERISHA